MLPASLRMVVGYPAISKHIITHLAVCGAARGPPCSSFYPGTGAATDIGVGRGRGRTINVAWSPPVVVDKRGRRVQVRPAGFSGGRRGGQDGNAWIGTRHACVCVCPATQIDAPPHVAPSPFQISAFDHAYQKQCLPLPPSPPPTFSSQVDAPPVSDGDYLTAWHMLVLPVVAEFRPDLILVSAGFDAVDKDPLGTCRGVYCGSTGVANTLVWFAVDEAFLYQ